MPLDEVIKINQDAVQKTSEPHLVLNLPLIESALARPKNYWAYGEEDMAVLATALLLGLAQNHGFAQGNKRTALTAAVMFLRENGYSLTIQDSMEFGVLITNVITGKTDEEILEYLIRHFAKPIDY